MGAIHSSLSTAAGVKCRSKFCRSPWQVTARANGSQAAQRNSVVYEIRESLVCFQSFDFCAEYRHGLGWLSSMSSYCHFV